MREAVKAYFTAAVGRPINLAEMSVDLWYPEKMRSQGGPQALLSQLQQYTMELVRDGFVTEVPGKEGELLYYATAHIEADKKRAADRLARAKAEKNDHVGKLPAKAKHAPIIIH